MVSPRAADPQLIESFILTLPEVLDARVLETEGLCAAYVTVIDDGPTTPGSIRAACSEALGARHTPGTVRITCARRAAA